ncbi:hypothetical protein [Selenomonas sp. AE3005]|uniref:beta strand repeat-containing protein n=1 Tax=Selenomonas sp. AE3005 TaxID=1485543 RepID=UPI0025F53886|nr:hypothetical protein [Selenomonas sp. AE3005]
MDFKFDLQMFAEPLYTGQLKFGVNSEGKFGVDLSVNTTKGSIAEQSAATSITAPTSDVKYYAYVTNTVDEDTKLNILSVNNIYALDSTGHFTDITDSLKHQQANGLLTGNITVTSSASQPVALDLDEAPGNYTVKNVAAGSRINLKGGDTLATTSLKAGEQIALGTVTTTVTPEVVDENTGEVTTPEIVETEIGTPSLVYTAASAGTLTFVGETTVDNTDPQSPVTSYNTVLQSGTIALAANSQVVAAQAVLSGGSVAAGDDVAVTTTDTDGIVVKVANGQVSSITGLNGEGLKAVVTEYSTASTGVVTATVTTYTALDEDGTMIQKSVATGTGADAAAAVTDAEAATAVVTFADIKSGAEVYKAKYSEATATDYGAWSTGAAGTNTVYYALQNDASAAAGTTNLINDNTNTGVRRVNAAADTFYADAGNYYLKVTEKTVAATSTKPATTTINSIELMQSNAVGKLSKVTTPAYTGTLTYDADGLAIVYNKAKTAEYHVHIENADITSKFTNLTLGAAGDYVTTQDATYSNLAAGTYTIYGGAAVANTVTLKGKANVTVAANKVGSVTGLDNGETVTIVTYDDTDGMSTTEVKATSATAATVTKTDAEGMTTVTKYKNIVNMGTRTVADIAAGNAGEVDGDAVVSISTNFDYTVNGSSVGYFAITGNGSSAKATVKTGKTTITAAQAENNPKYVKASVTNAGVLTLAAVELGVTKTAAGVITAITDAAEAAFSGTLSITAPSGTAITLNDRGVGADAILNITNLADNSIIAAVALSNEKDSVATAKLDIGDNVNIGGVDYVSGAKNNTLTFKGKGNAINFYSGTLLVDSNYSNGVTVGNYNILMAEDDQTITLTASTGKTFTLGELDNMDNVQITDNSATTPVVTTFTKYGSYLYDTANVKMFSLGTGTSATSAKLTAAANWKTYTNAAGAVTVNLALADTAIKKDSTKNYDFEVNKLTETANVNKARTAAVVVTHNDDPNQPDGSDAYITKTGDVTGKTYAAADGTAQTINATTGWTVTASKDAATTINGAASGTDKLIGNTGADTFNLKGAADTVVIDDYKGKDTISGYASVKDEVQLNAATTVYSLSTTKSGDVYAAADALADAAAVDAATNYVLLQGVGSKAVSISTDGGDTYADHYFGDGTKTTSATFTYATGAYYHANAAVVAADNTNTLKIGTLKDAASKTNVADAAIAVDLTGSADQYAYINVVDASGSANKVVLTAGVAAGTSYTLKGGTFKSTLTGGANADTLVGGTGEDTFVISTLAGADTIEKYTASKDVLQVTEALTAAKLHASNSDVVVGTGIDANDKVTITNAVNTALTINVVDEDDSSIITDTQTAYVGKEGTDNTFTVTTAPDANSIYVGSSAGTDTIKLNASIAEFTEPTTTNESQFKFTKYQGGTIDLSGPNYSSIEAVDASGVKVASALVSEYGSKFTKVMGGVSVTASETGTSFTGSNFDDLFTLDDATANDIYTTSVNQGSDIISKFGVGDVIQLNGLSTADINKLSAYAVAGTLETELGNGFSFAAGGKLTLTDDATATTYTLNVDANKKTATITATA